MYAIQAREVKVFLEELFDLVIRKNHAVATTCYGRQRIQRCQRNAGRCIQHRLLACGIVEGCLRGRERRAR